VLWRAACGGQPPPSLTSCTLAAGERRPHGTRTRAAAAAAATAVAAVRPCLPPLAARRSAAADWRRFMCNESSSSVCGDDRALKVASLRAADCTDLADLADCSGSWPIDRLPPRRLQIATVNRSVCRLDRLICAVARLIGTPPPVCGASDSVRCLQLRTTRKCIVPPGAATVARMASTLPKQQAPEIGLQRKSKARALGALSAQRRSCRRWRP